MLDIKRIKIGAQARARISEETIQSYADHLTDGGQFPPIIVYFDGTDYWLADGHHRLLAHQRIGILTILEEVKVGSKRDAMWYALGANGGHGLPMSNEDKRFAVEIALSDEVWSKLSNREIAKQCCCSYELVNRMRRGETATDKTAKNKASKKVTPVVTQEPEVTPVVSQEVTPVVTDACEYTDLEALQDQIADLQDQIAMGFFVGGDDERNLAKNTITALRNEVKTLKVTNSAVKSSLDELMRENTQLKAQIKRLEKKVA